MVERNKRFVYGMFHWPGRPTEPALTRPPIIITTAPNALDEIAVEVIAREYGANELIGKLYFKGSFNQWIALEPSKVENLEWFQWYKRLPSKMREAAKEYYFDMTGSGHWAVLHFRIESDETGPYVAVALRYSN